MKEVEKKLKAVANLRRLQILKYLKQEREATVQDIAGEIHLSFKATSRHLRTLFLADLLEKEQRSIYVYYRLAKEMPSAFKQILTMV